MVVTSTKVLGRSLVLSLNVNASADSRGTFEESFQSKKDVNQQEKGTQREQRQQVEIRMSKRLFRAASERRDSISSA